MLIRTLIRTFRGSRHALRGLSVSVRGCGTLMPRRFTSRMQIFNIAPTQGRRSSTCFSLAEVREEGSAVAGDKAQLDDDDVCSSVRQTALDFASPAKRNRFDPLTNAAVELTPSPTFVAPTLSCSALHIPTSMLRARAASPVVDEVHSSSSSSSWQRHASVRPLGLSPPTPLSSARSLLDHVANRV